MTQRIWGHAKFFTVRAMIAAFLTCAAIELGAGCKDALDAGQVAAVQAAYAAELTQCLEAAKKDSGTYQEYQDCACKVDRKYGVDAGGCP